MARYTAAMLSELETEIITAIQASPIAAYLRAVDALPDLTPDMLKRIMMAAPAVYAVAGDFNIADCVVEVNFELLCFAQHAARQTSARRGDATAIGLYPLMDALAFYFDGLATDSAIWSAKKGRFLRQGVWAGVNINPGVLTLTTKVTPEKVDLASLADFITFHGDYDIGPHQAKTEYVKWLQEPSDYSASTPELTDIINLESP